MTLLRRAAAVVLVLVDSDVPRRPSLEVAGWCGWACGMLGARTVIRRIRDEEGADGEADVVGMVGSRRGKPAEDAFDNRPPPPPSTPSPLDGRLTTDGLDGCSCIDE